MIIFNSVKDGLNYQTNCPNCHARLKINDRDATLKKEYSIDLPEKTFLVWGFGEDTITVDVDTEESQLTVRQQKDAQAPAAYTANFSATFNGQVFLRAEMYCDDCCQYAFMMGFIIDLNINKCKLLQVGLNSETLSIESSDVIHEIKNVYSSKQTEYTTICKDGHNVDRSTTLPLIPLNLQEPTKTLERIKNLLVFA